MIILSFMWLNAVGLLFIDLILGVYLLSQNLLQEFFLEEFHSSLLNSYFGTSKVCIYCLGVFSGPIYCSHANILCLIMPFIAKINVILSLNLVYCRYYLF